MALSVIGAGFGRTGTLSLKHALERLGLGPCYHMEEVIKRPERFGAWTAAVTSDTPDWDGLFEGYGATVDWPAATYWRQLAAHYPEAKVILSLRDPDSWFESTQNTIFQPALLEAAPPAMAEMLGHTIGSLFEKGVNDRECAIGVFERHNAKVIASIPPERLLVFQAKEGWEPLCAFLGCDVPDEPYPRVNDTADFKKLANQIDAMPAGTA